MKKTKLIVILVCLSVTLSSVAIAGSYQSRYGFGTGNFKAPDPLGLNNRDPLGLGNNYQFKFEESRPKRPSLYDPAGQTMGFINTDNGFVYSNQGQMMFRIGSDNGVYSTTGKHHSRIKDERIMYRRDGKYMGRIK